MTLSNNILGVSVVFGSTISPSPVVTFSSFNLPKHNTWYAAIKKRVLRRSLSRDYQKFLFITV